jgi:hypothetical protein
MAQRYRTNRSRIETRRSRISDCVQASDDSPCCRGKAESQVPRSIPAARPLGWWWEFIYPRGCD